MHAHVHIAGENRDRCVYDRAPPPVERGIKCELDLKRPAVAQLRPYHVQPYPRITKKDEQMIDWDWDRLSDFLRMFFRHSDRIPTSPQTTDDRSSWANFSQAGQDDYRLVVRKMMENSEPCVLLLCSPPGAGKSHFANELAELVKSKIGLRRAFIDGSDDRLVSVAPLHSTCCLMMLSFV